MHPHGTLIIELRCNAAGSSKDAQILTQGSSTTLACRKTAQRLPKPGALDLTSGGDVDRSTICKLSAKDVIQLVLRKVSPERLSVNGQQHVSRSQVLARVGLHIVDEVTKGMGSHL